MKQRSIKKAFRLSGIGIHSGRKCAMCASPASPNTGIVFIDDKGSRTPASLKQVKETQRGTTLGGIAVVEHFLAACYALGIDNLEIRVEGAELPALDGSAQPYAEALLKAGIIELNALRNPLILARPIRITEGEASLKARPFHGFRVNFMVDFPGIGIQEASFDLQKGDFIKEIAPARTFGYIEEYELLKENELARGANLENALVLGKDGYINSPRFPDEPARHKILDLLGDLCLLGKPLQADIQAHKSGHKLNVDLVGRILKDEHDRY